MKKSNFWITLAIVVLLSGCSDTNDKLKSYIESHCNFNDVDSCYIDIKDALKINYDEIYIFGETTMEDEISEIIGIPYKNDKFIPDSKYRMILLKDKKIVYEDDYYQIKTEFILNSRYNTLIYYYNRGSRSVYLVKKVVTDKGSDYMYILKDVPCK